jgi:hypothetical protein
MDPEGDPCEVAFKLQRGGDPANVYDINHFIREPGDYVLTETMTDSFGAVGTWQTSFSIGGNSVLAPGWSAAVVPGAHGERSFAATLVGGRPGLLAVFEGMPGLRWKPAQDAVGRQWPAGGGVAGPAFSSQAGGGLRLYEVNGRPAALGPIEAEGDWGYAVAGQPDGSGWTTTLQLSTNVQERVSAVELIDGRPAVAAATNSDVVFYRAADQYGQVWPQGTQLGGADCLGLDLYRAGSVPRIAAVFASAGRYNLGSFTAQGPWGVAWDEHPGVGDPWPLTSCRLIHVPAGRPLLLDSFDDTSVLGRPGGFAVQSALTPDCLHWSPPQLCPQLPARVYPGGGSFLVHPAVAVVGGRPVIAWHDPVAEQLLFLQAQDEFGSAWREPVVVDNRGDCGGQIQLLDVEGQPALLYSAETVWGGTAVTSPLQTELRLARRLAE